MGASLVFSRVPLPIVPRLSFYFSPASLQHKKASAEERGFIAFMVLGLRTLWYYVVIKVSTSHGFHRFPEFCDFKVSWFS